MRRVKVFVAGRLDQSKLENQKIYEIIAEVCESLGFKVWLSSQRHKKRDERKVFWSRRNSKEPLQL